MISAIKSKVSVPTRETLRHYLTSQGHTEFEEAAKDDDPVYQRIRNAFETGSASQELGKSQVTKLNQMKQLVH